MQNKNKFTIQIFKTLKSSGYFVKIGLDSLNNAPDNILNYKTKNNYKQMTHIWQIRCFYEK